MPRQNKIELILCIIALIILIPIIIYFDIHYEKVCKASNGTVHVDHVKTCIDKNGNKIELTNK